jgi:hypothetical protein
MPDAIEQSHVFGGGTVASVLSPAVALLLAVLGILILVLPRKYVIFPFLSGAFLIWLSAQIYVGGVHWLALRILILVACLRLALFRPQGQPIRSRFGGGFTGIDCVFVGYVIVQAVCVVVLFHQTRALINQFGFLIDYLGGYFVIRFLIQDRDDLFRALKCLAFLSALLAIGMTVEQLKQINIFALLAGVPVAPGIREGKIRSQGVFQHAIPAGTVAATWIPLFFLLWKNGKSKLMATIGLISASLMTVTSQSSTPLLAYAASIAGVCMWPMRAKMKYVRRAIVGAVIVLGIFMKAPVWFLIARIDLTGGSSGYHRALIVDEFIRHFWDWWLIGVKDTATWGWDLWDVQNQYVAAGETGGLIAFCLFVAMIVRAFIRLGEARKLAESDNQEQWVYWFIGCSLFSNALAFIGANYFDQSRISWFLILAAVNLVTASVAYPANAVRQPVPPAVRRPGSVPRLSPDAARSVTQDLKLNRT